MSRRPVLSLSSPFHRPIPELRHPVRNALQTSSVYRPSSNTNLGHFRHNVRFASKKPGSFQRVATKQLFGDGRFIGWLPSRALVPELEAAGFDLAQTVALCDVLWDRFRMMQVSKYTFELLDGYCRWNNMFSSLTMVD